VPDINDWKTLIKVIVGINVETLQRLKVQLEEAKGTPEEPRDWKTPSNWIPELFEDEILDKKTKQLAKKIYESGLNPRYFNYWYTRLAVRHGFLHDISGEYILTDRGRKFIEGDYRITIKYLLENGILKILEFLNEEIGATRKKLIEKWREWINTEGRRNIKSRTVLSESVISRINNVLIPLNFVQKKGNPRRYFLTKKGVKMVEKFSHTLFHEPVETRLS